LYSVVQFYSSHLDYVPSQRTIAFFIFSFSEDSPNGSPTGDICTFLAVLSAPLSVRPSSVCLREICFLRPCISWLGVSPPSPVEDPPGEGLSWEPRRWNAAGTFARSSAPPFSPCSFALSRPNPPLVVRNAVRGFVSYAAFL